MMTSAKSYRVISAWLLAVLTVVALVSGVVTLRHGIQIESDLQSLSPAIARDQIVRQTLATMSARAAQQITLVVLHHDEDTLELASEHLRENIEASEGPLQYRDQTALLDDYLAELAQQPFYFLDHNAALALEQHSDEQILNHFTARLFGSAGSTRLLAVQHDPTGYLSDYALAALNVLGGSGGDEIALTEIDGEQFFYTAHVLTLARDGVNMSAQKDILASVQALENSTQELFPGTQFLHSGIFFFAADAAQSAKKDITLITTGSAMGVLILLLVVFRSIKALLLPAVSILCGTFFAFVMCQTLFGSIHILTIVFGASLIGVVIDYSLHFFYFHKRDAGNEDSHLYRALLLSLCTSVIGYSGLSWSGLAALQQVAVFSGLGLLFAWLVVITLGPLLMQQPAIHDRYLQAGVNHLLDGCRRIPMRNWFILIIGSGVALSAIGGFSWPSDDNPRAFFSPSPQLIREEQQVNALFNDYEPGSFILVRGDSSQKIYDLIAHIENQLPAQSPQLLGAHRFFPAPDNAQKAVALNQRLYGDAGLALRFMQEHGFAPETITTFARQYSAASATASSPSPQAFFQRNSDTIPPLWIEHDGQISSFLLIPKTIDLEYLKQVVNATEGAIYLSAVNEATDALTQLRVSALKLLVVAFTLIAILMLLRLRSLQLTAKVLTVPGCTLVGTLLLLAALGIPLTLFHVMALFLVLGLGMDYVIFVRELPRHPRQTLAAIFLSAATSLLSFGLLSASSLPAVSGFGLTVLIGNSLNLIGSVILASRYINATTEQSASA